MKPFYYTIRYNTKEIDETKCVSCENRTTSAVYDEESGEVIPACTEHLTQLLYELNAVEKERVMKDGLSSGT